MPPPGPKIYVWPCITMTYDWVSAWVGDRLWTGKPPQCRTRHWGLLSLSLPSVAGQNEYPAKTVGGSKQAHRVIHQPYPWSRSVVLVPGWMDWLLEISADLREAVAHQRRVCDDALYKSTVTLLTYLPIFVSSVSKKWCRLRTHDAVLSNLARERTVVGNDDWQRL